ncbi:NAD-dependent malic enzyme [Cryobacterium zhongshanensis]|uniref:NAD-dependent malic enzyme n=1 Tax=Cryobacterium zhongshanensis TaxID=2928153 RepID=A0AA41UH40_9MICO|nr:NAD-dependent malic enzyme [Cryobacterium zhongshanensis]MCI4657984.1 NAD-dependent malic enzyme [Cryobacterium zhongshanensis]
MTGLSILADPYRNKGTAFTRAERMRGGITGQLPHVVQTIEQQSGQLYRRFLARPNDLEKRLFLMDVCTRNRRLFYYAMSRHLVEFLPIVYAPTVAQAIQQYSDYYAGSDVAYISALDPESIADALRIYANGRDIRLIVATDGEGILGIGDWGVNGAEILTGKVAVYTAAAGIDPAQILPVFIDVGTDNAGLLADPRYLGNRFPRIRGADYDGFIDAFVQTSLALFPGALLHWEDFGRATAAPILERYRDSICTLNDDIQGTGVTILAALNTSMLISGLTLGDQRVLVFGAGSAGIGIADQIVDEFVVTGGQSLAEAEARIYLMDRQGLIVDSLPDLTAGQRRYARPARELAGDAFAPALADPRSLQSVIAAVHPTALIGTSTQFGAFTEAAVREMAAHVERPLICPISNPAELAEATAADVIEWTAGAALVSTGCPSAPVRFDGIDYEIGQGNNALMYPGICFGAMVARATVLNRAMLLAAAHAIAGMVDVTRPGAAVLPSFRDLPEVSRRVAVAVVAQAVRDGVNGVAIADPEAAVAAATWHPAY